MDEFIFVNRRSKPHLRRKAKDHGAPPEALHPNKLQSRAQFAESAHAHYGKEYPEFIAAVRTDLTDNRVKLPAPKPVISEVTRSKLKYDAVSRGATPEIIDAITEVRPPLPLEIVLPELRKRARTREALSVIMPRR